ncbi:DUF6086 family protein [Micromonospora sp. KLBMP9576]|uniref:DUF6086 family protein n=1 Tax=Micromonospora sp. KLBMP9576 TaxID=3424769 RepID=UPI003D91CB58
MTYTFMLGKELVWSPANTVGALYIGMAHVVADVLKVPIGLTDVFGDTFDIDPVVFPEFVRAGLTQYAASHHPDLRLLVGSVLAVSIQLLNQMDATVETSTDAERAALDELRESLL